MKSRLFFAAAMIFTFAFSTIALAAPVRVDGRGARNAAVQWHKQRGLSSSHLRVKGFGLSNSGKSIRIAVENQNNGKVRMLNVRRSNNVAYKTPTGLTTQEQGAKKANNLMRRENAPLAGTFSGINRSGLSPHGNRLIYKSETDRNESVHVNVRDGRAYHFDF